jgi:hypothetical protein
MGGQSRIFVTVSAATKERLDRFIESHGLKENGVVEQALLDFVEAWTELPNEALLSARLVLDDKSFARIAAELRCPPAPTATLRRWMLGQGR